MPVMLALLLAADRSVALRADPQPLTQAEARGMTAAALADALLAPGHPRIVERVMLPEGMAPPPPSGSPPRLEVRLDGAPSFDAASGFCVRHSWRVHGIATGADRQLAPEPTRYRLPRHAGACDARYSAYFAVAPDDRPRAFTVLRLLADATRRAGMLRALVSIDDQEGAGLREYCARPSSRCRDRPTVLTDARRALADLPIDAVSAIGRTNLADADLLTPAELTAPDGRRRESWKLFAGGDWTVHLALDGDRIVAMRLRRAIPPPF